MSTRGSRKRAASCSCVPTSSVPLSETSPSQTTNNPEEFFKAARAQGWRGYLSSPRLATASYGARLQEFRSARDNALALAILDGGWMSMTFRAIAKG